MHPRFFGSGIDKLSATSPRARAGAAGAPDGQEAILVMNGCTVSFFASNCERPV